MSNIRAKAKINHNTNIFEKINRLILNNRIKINQAEYYIAYVT